MSAKAIGAAGIGIFVVFLGVQLYLLVGREGRAKTEYQNLQKKLDSAKQDNSDLKKELEYLGEPANLEKELRARFNYRSPDEKMIIIVPSSGTASGTNE